MPKNAIRSRELRQLAKEFVAGLSEDEFLPDAEREDIIGSLVRQWVTYDGNAALLRGDRILYLAVGHTPLGRLRVVPTDRSMRWKHLTDDWKIDPADLPDMIRQLTLAQSTEVTNLEGVPLRFWIDPAKRSQGVEPLVKQPLPSPPLKRDYYRIAADVLQDQFEATVAPDEMEALAHSVAAQWQRYQGHACIFLNAGEQLSFTFTELNGGNCNVSAARHRVNLAPLFNSLGFAPAAVAEVLVRLNLAEKVEFRDRNGVPSVLSHNPKTRQIEVAKAGPGPRQQAK